nr:hypothetical protein Itr_chr05CG03460 [Ipomoea trifida]
MLDDDEELTRMFRCSTGTTSAGETSPEKDILGLMIIDLESSEQSSTAIPTKKKLKFHHSNTTIENSKLRNSTTGCDGFIETTDEQRGHHGWHRKRERWDDI